MADASRIITENGPAQSGHIQPSVGDGTQVDLPGAAFRCQVTEACASIVHRVEIQINVNRDVLIGSVGPGSEDKVIQTVFAETHIGLELGMGTSGGSHRNS